MNEGSESMRVVVVGASSGLGRCIGTHLGQNGARVALLARREEALAEATREAGPDAIAVCCDVTDETSCREAIEEASERLGGLDGLVYSAGLGALRRLEDIDAELWRRTFDTNVIGAAIATAAALPHLQASGGVAAYLSSVQSGLTPPWPGLGSYSVSKAALDKLVEAWRNEHPSIGFTSVVVGECSGGEGASATQFASSWDPDLAAELAPTWIQRNYMCGSLIDVEELVAVVDTVLRCRGSASIPSVSVTPRPPATTT